MPPPLDAEKVAAVLSREGPIARRLPGYEYRREQVRMAAAVAETFERGGVLVVEAGTGVGKSLAYLVPAVHFAHERKRRVLVSTATINLQEQLSRLDLPFLAEHLGVPFHAVLVKGRGNYLCLKKAKELRTTPQLHIDDSFRGELSSILEWSEQSVDGSLADLDFVPRPEAWEQVVAEHDDCLRARCPDYERCFFYKARREAAEADVLVVNHHLLMSDLQLRALLPDEAASGVLPSATCLVVDEAHHLEDVTTDHFALRVTLRRIERILGRLQHQRVPSRGVLPALLGKLQGLDAAEDRFTAMGAARWIEESLRGKIPEILREAARLFGQMLHDLLTEITRRGAAAAASGAASPQISETDQLRIVGDVRASPFWSAAERHLRELAGRLDAFVAEIDPVLRRLQDLSPASQEATLFLASQLEALGGRLTAVSLETASFVADSPDLCRWMAAERAPGRPPALTIEQAPVEIGPTLRDALFQSFESVVLTSATLSVEGRFDFFADRSGLSLLPEGTVETLRLASPYHFPDQALIAVPADFPFPDTSGYEAALHDLCLRTVAASNGGAFLLFTSHAALARAHASITAAIESLGCPVFRQGDLARHALLERFRANRRAVLLGTDSFWEGVDVRGEGLRAVVIARLPFRVPTEPIVLARAEALEERGLSPFADYALPQAVIKLRQGFGRLIRSYEDTGVVVIADSRLARKSYGDVFLNSLPPARLALGPTEEVMAEVERFFR